MKKSLFAVILLLILAVVHPVAAQDTVRAGRISAGASLAVGSVDSDPAAILTAGLEYAIVERSTIGLGYAYVDGYLIQDHCVEAFARVYFLAAPIDLFVRPAIQIYESAPESLGVHMSLGAGVEWQSPWLFYLGASGTVLFQGELRGLMYGAFAGVRL